MLIFYGDTNSELWYEIVNKNKINMINMPYCLNGELLYADLGEHSAYIDFFKRVKNGEIPTTCGLNKQDYIDYFEKHLKNGDDIIYVTFSHKMSNTFEYMRQAIEELEAKYEGRSIKYIDTKQISVGEALILEQAYNFYKTGKTADEIIEFVEDLRDHVTTIFAVDDLNHLKNGGRISGSTAFFGTLLQIKPILEITKEGKIEKFDKAKGKKNVVSTLVKTVKERAENIADYPIIIIHAVCEDTANMLRDELMAEFGKDLNIRIQPVGPTIGTHCGPGTIGLTFHSKKA